MDNESFDRALEPQPSKRKRSSILKPAEKRFSRDSRTVSFNDRCIYKELHQDGTCDITNLFLREDMDLTTMDIVEPTVNYHNQTINDSTDMSMDQTSVLSNHNNSTLDNNNSTLTEDKMIDVTKEQQRSSPVLQVSSSPKLSPQQAEYSVDMSEHQTHNNSTQIPQQADYSVDMSQQKTHNNSSQMELTLINEFLNTMPKTNNFEIQSINYDTSTLYEKKMSIVSDMSVISSLDSTIAAKSIDSSSSNSSNRCEPNDSYRDTTLVPQRNDTTLINNCIRISEISSLNDTTLPDQSANETFFGAFHDSNNMSIQSSRTSTVDTMVHNIDALNECIQKVDQEQEDCRRMLDKEIEELFSFYRHIVNKDNKYEFAVRILGLRYSLWLIIRINPETYPNEKLNLKFAVNKRDRHLYPFPEYAFAVRHSTKEGRHGYLTRFVINAQRFRRFLRMIGYRKPNK